MSLHFPNRSRRWIPTERELQQAELRIRETAAPEQIGNHPARSELERFVAGRYSEGDLAIKRILDHLHDCNVCLATMAAIRSGSKRDEAIPKPARNRLLLSAAVVLVLLAILFLANRAPAPSTVATVDLRQVTRGQEEYSIIVDRTSATIRVLLPIGSTGGHYDVGVFSLATLSTPILLASAQSRIENGDEVIAVSIPIKQLQPGRYLLGVRSSGSQWRQYAINIK